MGASFSHKPPSSESAAARLSQFLHKEQPHLFTNTSPLTSLFSSTARKGQGEGDTTDDKEKNKKKKKAAVWMPFSKVSLLSGGSHAPNHSYDDLQLQLLGIHNIGPRTYIETVLQGTKIQLEEVRLTLLHTFSNSKQADERKIWESGQITIFAGTDFRNQRRLSLESILGSEERGLTFATILSTNVGSGISWGFAHSDRPYNKLTLFSRFTNDENTGKRIILQAVQKLNEKNTLSHICAVTLGNQPQAGISWTHQFNSGTEDTLQVKALCSTEGSFSVNVKANVGEVQ